MSGLKQNFTDGTCARGVIFFVQGESLFETLALNLIRFPDRANDVVMPCTRLDAPAWEMDDPCRPDRSVPFGYLDYLTWQSRRILFFPETLDHRIVVGRITVAPALRLNRGMRDPMKHYQAPRSNTGWYRTLRFSEERSLWRDSAALFRLQRFQDDRRVEHSPPWALNWLAQLSLRGYLDPSTKRRFLALGMASRLAKVHFYRREQLPLPLAYLRDGNLVDRLQKALSEAEAVARELRSAGYTLARYVLAPESDAKGAPQPQLRDLAPLAQRSAMDRRYWSQLELSFGKFVEALLDGSDQAVEAWTQTVRRTAWAAFDEATQGLDHRPRTLKAVVRARGRLAQGLGWALRAP